MRQVHTVACLAGDGVGPELMAQATRTLRNVARMHGFAVEDVHAPFGSEALTRSGHPLPPATRTAVLDAEAVLVAAVAEPALDGIAADLDLRARLTRVLLRSGDVVLASPLDDGAERFAVDLAFRLAGRRRGRVVSVDRDARWAALVDETASRHEDVVVEHASLGDAVRALAFGPQELDVVVTSRTIAPALEELATDGRDCDRLAAVGLLAENGPSVFGPAWTESRAEGGQGVADPGSMLLAVSQLLGEGLGQAHAADTLASALRRARAGDARPSGLVRRTLSASTREVGDAVVSLLPVSHRNAEFVREATA